MASRFALYLIVPVAAAIMVSGCAVNAFPGGTTPIGVVYTDMTMPAANLAVATDTTAKCAKIGESIASGIMGFTFGDASIDAAMKDGKIKRVHHVDHQFQQLLYMVYTKDTTIVYGE